MAIILPSPCGVNRFVRDELSAAIVVVSLVVDEVVAVMVAK
jgi:hypothetical protein